MTLTLKPTDLGAGKIEDDFVVLDENRATIGRILWTHAAFRDTPWFRSITPRVRDRFAEIGHQQDRADDVEEQQQFHRMISREA